jgi:hypothetical protein
MYLDASWTPCPIVAVRQVLVGCHHEHIASFSMCAEHAEATMQQDGTVCCDECSDLVASTVETAGIVMRFEPHECPLMALPDPRGLPKPEWREVGWISDEGIPSTT